MAELNLNQIAAKLNEAFTGDARQLIFWYDENGEFIGYSVPGIGGGKDYYGKDGEYGYSVDSAFGGSDYYGSNGEMAYSVDSPFGGETIYGEYSGIEIDSPLGGSDIFLD